MPHEQQATAEQLDLESGGRSNNIQDRREQQRPAAAAGDIPKARAKNGGRNSWNSSTATSQTSSSARQRERQPEAGAVQQQQQDIKTPDEAASERLLGKAQFQPVAGEQQPSQEVKLKVATSKTGGGGGARQRRAFFINPSGHACYWWSAVVSVAFLYNFWSASYRFAFGEIDSSTYVVWLSIDLMAELVYYLDILVNNKTGFLEDGVLQRDPKRISAHYQESNLFYLDVFCILPFDILYLSFGYNSIFRCNRLVKIYKFWSFVDRTERHTNYPNLFRTCTLVHNILVIFHWNACIFHMISTKKIIDIEQLYKIDDDHCKDVACQYLHAFYWSTLAIIGNLPRPKRRGEYIYVILELIFGLILFAWVLGHVANIVTNVSAARKEFQARLDAVKTFMRTRRVSDELQTKVIRWFDYLWSSQKSSDEERSVACLPDRLKAEIAIHVNLNTLERVDIFRATEVGFLRELVLRLKPVLFSPGDYVCRKDEAGHEMYIVSKGRLEVVTDEPEMRVVATFKGGSYFGEIAVLNVGAAGNKRTASVRSVGYSDLFCLSKSDLWDVLKDYPLAEARIRAVAEERLSALGAGNRGGGGGGGRSGSSGPKRARSSYNAATTTSTSPNPSRIRRLSQRSSRSRVQPMCSWDQQQQQQETLVEANLLLAPQPQHSLPLSTDQKTLSAAANRLRARYSTTAGSHRGPTAAGSEFPARKCANSRTMEPICNTMDSGAGRPNVLVHSMNDSSLGRGGGGGGGAASGCRHQCRHHSTASVSCHTSELQQHCRSLRKANDEDEAFAPDLERTRQRRGELFNFVASSPWKCSSSQSNQVGGGKTHARHLSVQPPAHLLGQSRSFECSPLGGASVGVEGVPELLNQANRSRSGAALLPPPPKMGPLQLQPPPPPPPPLQITDERNQTLDLSQTTDCFPFDASSSCSRGEPDCGHQLSRRPPVVETVHRAHLCLHQERPSLSSLSIDSGSQMRARSSSMTTRPLQVYEHEQALAVASECDDDDDQFEAGRFEVYDRQANFTDEDDEEDDDDEGADDEADWPMAPPNATDTLLRQRDQQTRRVAPDQQQQQQQQLGRRQRHRSDCRHRQRDQRHHQYHQHHDQQQQRQWRQMGRQNAEVEERDYFQRQHTSDSTILCPSSSAAMLTSSAGRQPPYGSGARMTRQSAAGMLPRPPDDSPKRVRDSAAPTSTSTSTGTTEHGPTSSEQKQAQQQVAESASSDQQRASLGDLSIGVELACRIEMERASGGDGVPPDGDAKKRFSDP